MCNCSNNRDMKQLINLLNTTLQCAPKSARQGRPDSARDTALSSVAAADDDNSDVAIVPPQMSRPNLGVTFVKASPSVIRVPPQLEAEPNDDAVHYVAQPQFQLGDISDLLTYLLTYLLLINSYQTESYQGLHHLHRLGTKYQLCWRVSYIRHQRVATKPNHLAI